ncbi:MAG: Type III restriction-modification system methylation subunit (EC [uncultured Sulfurovum sp.]|uniref:site-specific DNA-methyltransferase (adenine-specific) n=1 Tax=uncultured Sulfurovum sp. TaxID=269237 RepID=A0A6S6SDH7_9BACT|nr:MAG: Type III restriction-modification system methylation subunit (EC [uncultured Sulfurovum sp.]
MPLNKNVIDEQSVNDNKYKELKRLFPHAVSIDENGKYLIDREKLQMDLEPSLAETKEEGYGLNWVGKKEAYHTAFSKNQKVLKPLEEQSKDWGATGNILLKGDNLDALKILRQNYFEAIKMIYIDPPYNTKNDGFVYNDNFTETTEETLDALGYDKEYVDYIENIQGAKTHSGWLSFMYPRLLLAKDLLKEDGVIFISIDDNEVAQLRLLCDEVFGEENFVASIIWEKKYSPSNDAKWFSDNHDYVLIYTKNKEIWRPRLLPRTDEQNKRYKNPDNDSRGNWKSGDLSVKTYSESYDYSIKLPSGKIVNPPKNKCWRVSKSKFQELVKDNRIWFGSDGNSTPSIKRFLTEVQDGTVPLTIWKYTDVGHNQDATKELRDLFDGNIYFDTPKPTKLLNRILYLSTKSNDIILDFFAGSGTTAHAVMDFNAKDNGNRKFILVQWAEETPEKSEARKAGYETIFDITKERIDRAGEQIGQGDIGFRTFEVVEDVKQKLYQKPLDQASQEDLLSFSQTPSIESHEEILYNLLVAESLSLSSKVEVLMEQKLYRVENVLFILGSLNIDELVTHLKALNGLEYITVYSPLVDNDKFTLELESAVEQVGIKGDKLRFRG